MDMGLFSAADAGLIFYQYNQETKVKSAGHLHASLLTPMLCEYYKTNVTERFWSHVKRLSPSNIVKR
jgi:hypothetical protein